MMNNKNNILFFVIGLLAIYGFAKEFIILNYELIIIIAEALLFSVIIKKVCPILKHEFLSGQETILDAFNKNINEIKHGDFANRSIKNNLVSLLKDVSFNNHIQCYSEEPIDNQLESLINITSQNLRENLHKTEE